MLLERNRLTHIAFETSNGDMDFIGTGYVVGPGLILTATHVLFRGAELVPADLPIRIRVLGDLRRLAQSDLEEFEGATELKLIEQALKKHGDQFQRAELIWPVPGTSPNLFDIALLSVSKGGPAESCHSFSNVMLAPTSDSEGLGCRTGGFPAWRQHVSGTFRFPGLVLRDAALKPTELDYTAELIIGGDGPADATQWKGMSGGPVWADVGGTPTLIGVVHSVESSAQNRLLSIKKLPPYVSAKLNKPDHFGFWRAANRSDQVDRAVSGVVTRPVTRSNANDYIHIVDRQPHDARIEIGCNKRYKNGSQKPAVILLHGRNVDAPSSYLMRWRSGDLDYKKLTGNIVQPNSGYLAWPRYSAGSIEERFQLLRSAIVASSIEPQASDAARDPNPPRKLRDDDPAERFREYFAAGRLPRTFSIFLDPAQTKDEDFELLTKLLQLFTEIAAVADVVTLFITLVYKVTPGTPYGHVEQDSEPLDETAAKVWTRLEECLDRHDDDLHVWNAGALTEIDSEADIEDWRQKLERKNVYPNEGFFVELRSQILATGTVPLADFPRLVKLSQGAS